MRTTDIQLTPAERFHELAGILAGGLVRIRTRTGLMPASRGPGEHAEPDNSSLSFQKPLGFSATPRTDCLDG